jgi:hypothetical protein
MPCLQLQLPLSTPVTPCKLKADEPERLSLVDYYPSPEKHNRSTYNFNTTSSAHTSFKHCPNWPLSPISTFLNKSSDRPLDLSFSSPPLSSSPCTYFQPARNESEDRKCTTATSPRQSPETVSIHIDGKHYRMTNHDQKTIILKPSRGSSVEYHRVTRSRKRNSSASLSSVRKRRKTMKYILSVATKGDEQAHHVSELKSMPIKDRVRIGNDAGVSTTAYVDRESIIAIKDLGKCGILANACWLVMKVCQTKALCSQVTTEVLS